MEPLKRAKRILSQQFEDAPQTLRLTIDLAMDALRKESKGEALNELRKADALVKKEGLTEWEAEMFAAWAVYYFHIDEETEMYQAIRKAQQREPDNKRVEALRDVLLESRG